MQGASGMGRAEYIFSRLETEGYAYIESLVREAKHEEHYLDFKQTGAAITGRSLHESDRKNLRRALSGFANSDGGVIVWGVGARKDSGVDVPTMEPAIDDCVTFVGLVEAAISGSTIPPVPGVRSIRVLDPNGDGRRGYVATLVSASPEAPHRSLHDERYLIRSGSDFVPVTHAVLAGLFGRKPRPEISLMYGLGRPALATVSVNKGLAVELTLMLLNHGTVVSSDAYATWTFEKAGGVNCRINLLDQSNERWQIDSLHSRIGSCLSQPSNRMAPNSRQNGVRFAVRLVPPFSEDLVLKLTCGCSGAPPTIEKHSVSASELTRLVAEGVALLERSAEGDRAELEALAPKLLGIPAT